MCAVTATAVDQTLFRESFAPIPVDLRIDGRMDNYVPFFRRLLPHVRKSATISAIDLRSIADDWIRASHSGQLLPLETSFHGEEIEDSPKGQLVEATMRFSTLLTDVANAELANGMVDDAVADSIRAAAVLDSVRFASPTTMMMTASTARRSLSMASANISRVKSLPALLGKQLELNKKADERYLAFLKRSEQMKLVYTVRYGTDTSYEDEIPSFIGIKETDAQRFYGIDRERSLAKRAKACKFVQDSQAK